MNIIAFCIAYLLMMNKQSFKIYVVIKEACHWFFSLHKHPFHKLFSGPLNLFQSCTWLFIVFTSSVPFQWRKKVKILGQKWRRAPEQLPFSGKVKVKISLDLISYINHKVQRVSGSWPSETQHSHTTLGSRFPEAVLRELNLIIPRGKSSLVDRLQLCGGLTPHPSVPTLPSD